MVSAETQPARSWAVPLLNSNINTKLGTVDHTAGIRTNIRWCFSDWTFSQHRPKRLTSFIERGNEKSQAWTCLKRRTLFTTHKALAASQQQQSSQSIYAIYQGGNLSLLSSLTLPICHRETK